MTSNLQHYDTSAYPKTHPIYNPANAKVIGKFKGETNSIPPEEFVGLISKMYSLKCNYPKMTAKGIKKSYMKHHVRHLSMPYVTKVDPRLVLKHLNQQTM